MTGGVDDSDEEIEDSSLKRYEEYPEDFFDLNHY